MRGTGSIDELPSGRFRVRLTMPNGDRKSLAKGETFATRDEAEAACAAALEVLSAEGFTMGTSLLEFGRKLLEERELGGDIRDPHTDWSRWNNHVKDEPIAAMALQSIRLPDVQEWFDGVRKKVGHQTAINTLNVLRVIFRRAERREMIKRNPCKGVELPKQKTTHRPWTFATPDEQAAIRAGARAQHQDAKGRNISLRDEAELVEVAMGAGIRAGELVALRLSDVHVDVAEPHMVIRYGGAPSLPTKSGKIREVPLFGSALDAMRRWLAALPGFAKENPHGLAFPRMRGGFRDENHIVRWEQWKAVLRVAGITRRFRWHDLRHTCASALISGWWGRRWAIEEICALLGHSSIVTTQRYAHLADSALKRAAAETGGGDPPRGGGGGGGGSRLTVTPWPRETQPVDISQLCSDFVNRRSGVQVPKAALGGIVEENSDSGSAVRDRDVTTSFAVLSALAEGRGSDADDAARALAADLLAEPPIRWALAVAAGAPVDRIRAAEIAAERLAAAPPAAPHADSQRPSRAREVRR